MVTRPTETNVAVYGDTLVPVKCTGIAVTRAAGSG